MAGFLDAVRFMAEPSLDGREGCGFAMRGVGVKWGPKRKQTALRPYHEASISRQCAPGSPGPLQLIGKEPQRALHGVFRRNGIGLIALTLGARIVEAM